MEHSGSVNSGIHYHTYWSDSFLDWKPFPTEADAAELAEQIKNKNQSYTVVERDDECERCKAFRFEAYAID